MVQQISDAELEIMKIVWGNRSEVTLFPYIMDGLAARGRPCQKNTLIVLLLRLMNKGFLIARKIGRSNEYTTLVSETEYQTAICWRTFSIHASYCQVVMKVDLHLLLTPLKIRFMTFP